MCRTARKKFHVRYDISTNGLTATKECGRNADEYIMEIRDNDRFKNIVI